MTHKLGSMMRNLVTFNPLQWKSKIDVEFDAEKVFTSFRIKTSFQVATSKEENLWENFISNYQSTIETGKAHVANNQAALLEKKISSLTYILFAVISAVIFGIPAGIIAHKTGIDGLASAGASVGAVAAMSYRIKIDKEKNEIST